MAWSLVASAAARGPTVSGGGTSPINTTGATLLVAVGSGWTGNNAVSDSKGNTWTPLTDSGDSGNAARIWYVVNPTVGTDHRFSAEFGYTSVAVTAWTGNNIASPVDVQASGGRTTSSLPLYAGSVTPTQNDSLIIAGLSSGKDASAYTISDGLTVAASAPGINNVTYGAAIAYLVQTTAAAINPGWSWTFNPSVDGAAALAVFKGAAAGGGVTLGAASSTQTSTSSATALTQRHLLGAGTSTQAQASSATAITQGATHVLGNAASTQAQTSAATALTQRHLLGAASSTQASASTATALTLGTVTVLGDASSTQGTVSAATGIAQTHALGTATSAQAQSSAATSIVQRHVLGNVTSAHGRISSATAINLGGPAPVRAAITAARLAAVRTQTRTPALSTARRRSS